MSDVEEQKSDVEEKKAAARDATNWAKKVSTLNVSEVPEGAININVEGKRLAEPDPGLREDVAEDLPGAPAAGARVAHGPDRDLEAALPGLLAGGQQLLRAADRHRAGRRGAAQHDAAREDEALHRRDGALRRRGVLHADDAAGPHVRRLDHLQRDRARRRDGRPGAGADARVGPDLRDGPDAGRPQAGGPLLEPDADGARRALRPRGRGRHPGRVRRQEAPVVEVAQRLALVGDPLDALHARRAGARREAAVCLTPSSSARAPTAWRRRSRSPAPGRSVRVLEAAETVGGGSRSAELTLPGFVHDVCSAVHPHPLASPFLRELPLGEHGLELVHPDAPLAHPLDDGEAVVLERSVEATAASIGGADGEAYRALLGPLVRDAERLLPELLGPLRPPRHPLAMARFGLVGMRSAQASRARASTDRGGARCWPARRRTRCCASTGPRPPRSRSCSRSPAITVGWPVARGGSQAVADALASYLRSLGGEIETGRRVESVDELDDAGAVLLDVTPRQVLALAGHRLPRRYRRALGRFRYGPGVFKLDWALDGPIPGRHPDCGRAGTVHLGGPRGDRGVRGGRRGRPRARAALRAARPADAVRPQPRAGGQARRMGLLPRAERLDRGHDRPHRGADRALRARLRRAGARPRHHERGRKREDQPPQHRRGHQNRGGRAPPPLPPPCPPAGALCKTEPPPFHPPLLHPPRGVYGGV